VFLENCEVLTEKMTDPKTQCLEKIVNAFEIFDFPDLEYDFNKLRILLAKRKEAIRKAMEEKAEYQRKRRIKK
jgi:hypothetical protein